MPIAVICPGCRKEFKVSDQFAGKSGPCPSCKTVIKVPLKEEEVKVHTPEQFASGGRGMGGKMVAKPIRRLETTLTSNAITLGVVIAVAAVAGAWIGGKSGWFDNLLVRSAALLLVSPPVAVAGYKLLASGEDLEHYEGMELFKRGLICAVAYAALWGVFMRVSGVVLTGEIYVWFLLAPPFFVVGAMAALSSLDLDFGSGFLHYGLYVLVTLFLRWLANLPALWNVPSGG